ncbi:MAG: DEAD/DEAH box helicase, partial [Pirellulales bacterium]
QAYTELSGKGVRIHPLTAAPLAEVLDEVGSLRADKSWKDQLDRLQAAQQLEPQLPSTFCGELRDYQLDGYRWLQRLAHLGAGACLADDMGLGKTIQVLATLIERGNDGPALVVAPTSVCPNWQREAARFAPTLNVIRFGYDNADRGGVIDALGSRDVLVTSYALLQQEIEMLSQCRFRTIVLDEAQAIKNMGTMRSQAAMALQGDFRIITTGTPIENHLGDLWNLFRFINPGLLRSSADFNRRFAVPIEKEGDANARGHLKKLIHPFVLRRTKDQVLDELPPRTEIVLEVEMSVEEAALYESLRQAALERLEEGGQKTKAKGQRHLQVLAELMKLRRMCCNPKLLLPDWRGPESKLTVFAETLEELIENRHKVLVFSQFVDHLTILREFLDQRGVTYQYLDGSTPARQRQQRIDAFQAGDGDVFLISLKAGGVGLNLTAADYVIHMDPWWNPAVEDQASDRAHRIGQQRPVTIYRLVTKGTIEEKIVELHHRKRDLAQQLLDGADVSGKMSVDQLIKILRDA